MLIKGSRFNVNADRAFTRSAIHSEHFNISIRAVYGERASSNYKFTKKAIDNSWQAWFYDAIEMLVIEQMKIDALIQQVVRHISSNAPQATNWFVGIRIMPRLHPWDQAELLVPTSNWIDLQADSPSDAHLVVRRLLELGIAKSHKAEQSPNADHVFAYALNRN